MTGRPGRGGRIPTVDKSRMAELDKRHPDFEAGNLVALKHGASSPRMLEAKSAELHSALVEVAPWVTQLDRGAVDRYVRHETKAVLLSDYVITVAFEQGPEHVPVMLWDASTRAELAADKLAGAIGLTPESRARLLKDIGSAKRDAASLKDLMAKGGATKAGRATKAVAKRTPAPRKRGTDATS